MQDEVGSDAFHTLHIASLRVTPPGNPGRYFAHTNGSTERKLRAQRLKGSNKQSPGFVEPVADA